MLPVRNIARIIVPVLLAVTLCFLTNTTINQHFHKLSSGIVIKHAHPFDKENTGNPFQKHQHSSSELVLLDQMYNTVFWIYLSILFLTPLLFENEITNSPFVITLKNPDFYFLRNYHAPPAYSY
ncbi:MAG: hypothetical protein MUC93_10500 [Bacteroidales bacterium]|nr:hypothetical protein [Bacteroidales bacterium]